MPDPSHVCDLLHSSQQCRILNPLSEAWDRTRVLMDTSQVLNHWVTMETPRKVYFLIMSKIYLFTHNQLCMNLNRYNLMWRGYILHTTHARVCRHPPHTHTITRKCRHFWKIYWHLLISYHMASTIQVMWAHDDHHLKRVVWTLRLIYTNAQPKDTFLSSQLQFLHQSPLRWSGTPCASTWGKRLCHSANKEVIAWVHQWHHK